MGDNPWPSERVRVLRRGTDGKLYPVRNRPAEDLAKAWAGAAPSNSEKPALPREVKELRQKRALVVEHRKLPEPKPGAIHKPGTRVDPKTRPEHRSQFRRRFARD